MERVWRKVNQGLSNKVKANPPPPNITNETAAATGFGDVSTVTSAGGTGAGMTISTSTVTGRRLASSGQQSAVVNPVPFSQQVINTASSERRRRRRRKSRPRRNGERNGPQSLEDTSNQPTEAASTVAAKRNAEKVHNGGRSTTGRYSGSTLPPLPPLPSQATATTDPSLRQRAVAKLRLFNFNLNWDLHMTQCKPCGPRSSGNILTRRLCRNRRREDNELYRSNSFKFERFDRRDGNENSETLKKQISVCDDYSLPIDFVKKRPSSFDPGFAKHIPDNWTAPSPVAEHVKFLDPPGIVTTNPSQQIKLVEGYSDPKDLRKLLRPRKSRKDKSSEYNTESNRRTNSIHSPASDSSAPKSSAEDEDISNKFPELNSPDSISEDLIRPLQPHKSPKRIPAPELSKRNPSPYYYSDLLKSKEDNTQSEYNARQSTASEPPQLSSNTNFPIYKKSVSLDVPETDRDFPTPKRYSITEEGVRIIRCNTPSTTTSEDSDCSECQKRREWHAKALAVVREKCNITETTPAHAHNLDNLAEASETTQTDSSMPPHRLLGPAVCACTAPTINDEIDEFFRPRSIFYVHQKGAHECVDCAVNVDGAKFSESSFPNDEMSSGRTREIYETAFDCKIARSDDDLDEMDRVTNQSVMIQTNNGYQSEKASDTDALQARSQTDQKRVNSAKYQAEVKNIGAATNLAENIERMKLDEQPGPVEGASKSVKTPARRYTPSPPSTAPLPVKFPGKHDRDKFFMNSIRSAPNLPVSHPSHSRLKDLRHAINDICLQQEIPAGSEASMVESSYNPPPRCSHSRPRSVVLESGRVIELRKSHHSRRRHGRDYSSTESMATSSSGGSMESLRSSTSEGNRSTTSSGSRQSTSLSSHSSDSGHNVNTPARAPLVIHSKLHILSPISDKSSQEPASESSELNHSRQNNSLKTSPADEFNKNGNADTNRPNDDQHIHDVAIKQLKRKAFPNKTLLHLTDEIIGSDSGISLHSREEGRSTQSALQKFVHPQLNLTTERGEMSNQTSHILPQDLHDLPFDMPKLRRRKQLLQQDHCTSGSATSVDLGDLPFDMPKLRRRLRMNPPLTTNLVAHSTESSGISQASSSHSVRDDRKQLKIENSMFRQNLTLNLNETRPPNKFGSLDLKGATCRGLNLNIGNSNTVDVIDANIPLNRQGWYHGAITRIEAENTLRSLSEGSFLVRNCESTKLDYSLSLKSAKGFMHMRIQRNDAGQYVLGQFSRPFDSVPEMIRHFCLNRLPVRGAEHMCLIDPVIVQLL